MTLRKKDGSRKAMRNASSTPLVPKMKAVKTSFPRPVNFTISVSIAMILTFLRMRYLREDDLQIRVI